VLVLRGFERRHAVEQPDRLAQPYPGLLLALPEAARQAFGEKEFVDLTFAVAAINALNRIAMGFKGEPEKD